MDEIEFVKLPVYRENKIAEDASEVSKLLFRLQRDEDEITDDMVFKLIAHTLGINTDIPSQRIAISCSCADLTGLDDLSAQQINATSYRLAANKDNLKKGWAVPPDPNMLALDTVIAEVQGVRKNEENGRVRGALQIGLKLLTGKLAGKTYRHNCSWKTGTYLYGICTGFPRKAAYQSPKQLVGLRVGMSIGWEDSSFVLEKFVISKSVRSSNVKLARSRSRDIADCPFNQQIDCLFCRVGRNECPRSVNTKATQLIQKRNKNG